MGLKNLVKTSGLIFWKVKVVKESKRHMRISFKINDKTLYGYITFFF